MWWVGIGAMLPPLALSFEVPPTRPIGQLGRSMGIWAVESVLAPLPSFSLPVAAEFLANVFSFRCYFELCHNGEDGGSGRGVGRFVGLLL